MPNSTFCGGREHKRTAFFFLLELRYSLLEFVNSRKNCQLLTKWKKWNKRDEVWSSETLPFKWRFRCRRCCLSSLKRPNGFWGAGVKRETRERRVKRASCSRPKTCLSAKTWRILARIFNTEDTVIFHDSFWRNSLGVSLGETRETREGTDSLTQYVNTEFWKEKSWVKRWQNQRRLRAFSVLFSVRSVNLFVFITA